MNNISLKQKRFFILIYLVTVISFVIPIMNGKMEIEVGNFTNIIVFIILTAITESFTVSFKNMSFSTSFAVTIASFVLFGTFECIIILILGFLCRVIKVDENIYGYKYKHVFNTPLYGTIFNCCALILFIKYGYLGIAFITFPLLLIRYTLLLYSDSKSQFIDTVEALMNAIDARDQYTEGHSRRVAEISVAIGKELKYNQWNIEELNIAAMLHDVGKIGVSDAILNKPGKLTDEEFDAIKEHPEIGIKIIKDIKNIDYVYPVVRNHHERYDGKGYPDGKKGDELPLNVYIVQLADTVDAMASDRPYRKGLSESIILEEIKKYSGTQFHPKVAETYLRIVGKNGGKLP